MWRIGTLAALVATVAVAGCASLAGLDEDYRLGEPGLVGGASSTTTGTGATGTGTTTTATATTSTQSQGGSGATTTGTGGGPLGGGGAHPGGEGPGGSGAAAGALPTWHFVETLHVPLDGTQVQSGAPLTLNGSYQLRASGYFECTAGATECDAEYVDDSPPRDIAGDRDFGIAINADTIGTSMEPYWGDHSSLHEYTVPWQGDGNHLRAELIDPVYSNNYGDSLRVDIFVLQ